MEYDETGAAVTPVEPPAHAEDVQADDAANESQRPVRAGAVAFEGDTPVYVAHVFDDGATIIGRFASWERYDGSLATEPPAHDD